jgi:hydrogenase maturation protease
MKSIENDMAALVLGFGNELRGDDGIGQAVARVIEAGRWPGVRVCSCHQLTPEVAELLAGVELAIFVDSCANSGHPIQINRARPMPSIPRLTHSCTPETLLALAGTLYGSVPEAWFVTVRAQYFDAGLHLSEQGERLLPLAVACVEAMLAVD